MEPQKFSWRKRIRSFVFAFNGVKIFFRREHNAWIHAAAALLVLIAAALYKLTAMEIVAVLFAIALVWMAELLNTAMEKLMDHLSPAVHPAVKEIKDMAAGAVLIAAFFAVLIALIIFIPKIV